MYALNTLCTAFEGPHCIASGTLDQVALAAKRAADVQAAQAQPVPVLVFMDSSSEVLELDWRGSEQAFVDRLRKAAPAPLPDASADDSQAPDATRGPGRPRLGVVAREVTLLPRHWAWLAQQPGGASVALRKLVDGARRDHDTRDRLKQAVDAAYKFMSIMTGNLPGFEEACRALFAGDAIRFEAHTASWPVDLRQHLDKLLAPAFSA